MSLDATEMRDAYLRAALFTATDSDSGEPLDKEFEVTDFDENSRADALRVCAGFIEANRELLEAAQQENAEMDSDQAGHDLWMTRNHHGVGFWEQEWGSGGDKLTAATQSLGEAYVEVGENEGSRYLYIVEG